MNPHYKYEEYYEEYYYGIKYLFPLSGETDGAATTGVVSLNSHFTVSSASNVRIPRGLKLKIWSIRISGKPVTFKIEFTQDIEAATPTFITVETFVLISEGELMIDKQKKPLVFEGKTGKEAIRISWSQATAAKSFITTDNEFCE
jgi:hypothetical protein